MPVEPAPEVAPQVAGCEHPRLAFARGGALLACSACGAAWAAVKQTSQHGGMTFDHGRAAIGERVDMQFARTGE